MLRYLKKVDSCGKIFIPKAVVNTMGKEYYLEIYEDKMILIPIKDKTNK